MSARAEQSKQAGNAAFKAGDLELALAHYSTAIQLDPSISTYPLNRALVHLKLRNHRDADKDATKALELEGGQGAKALFRRGLARKALGRLDAARQDFEEAKRQGAGDDVANELAALVKQLAVNGNTPGAKKPNGVVQPTPSPASEPPAKASSPSTERLRAAIASPSSSSPSPAKPAADGLMTAVSSRRLTPSTSSSSQPSSSAPAPIPAVSEPGSFAAKKEARAAKQQQPPRREPPSAAPEEPAAPPSVANTPPSAASTQAPSPALSQPSASAPPAAAPAPAHASAPAPAAASPPTTVSTSPASLIPSSFLRPTPSSTPAPASATALETHFLLTPAGTASRLALLRALDPRALGAFFGPAGVAPELLSAILAEVLPLALIAGAEGEKELDWVVPLLRGLSATRRWDAAVLFLEEGEREGVRRVLEREEARGRRTREAWGV